MALQLDVASERARGPLRPPAAPPLASPASSASAPDETAPRDWLRLAQLILRLAAGGGGARGRRLPRRPAAATRLHAVAPIAAWWRRAEVVGTAARGRAGR